MTGLLAREIHQTKAFANPMVEAYLSLLRTTEVLSRDFAEILRRWDLTQSQYNILRILRGAGETGLSCTAIGERLVTLDPDVTRLLDKLERRFLVRRVRNESDRRVVLVHITDAGRGLCENAELHISLTRVHEQHFDGIAADEITSLINLLERLRSKTPTQKDPNS